MANHLIEDVKDFLIVERVDFVESFKQTFDLFNLVMNLNKNIIHYKKVLIVAVKQSKYGFDTINIDSSDINKK